LAITNERKRLPADTAWRLFDYRVIPAHSPKLTMIDAMFLPKSCCKSADVPIALFTIQLGNNLYAGQNIAVENKIKNLRFTVSGHYLSLKFPRCYGFQEDIALYMSVLKVIA
jgi:hypothetical protein